MVNSLAALDGQMFQTPNPGGARTLLAILVADIVGNYPTSAQIDVATQRITALPTLVATKKFSEYAIPDGTLDYKVDDSGEPGYQSFKHSIEFALAGSSDALHGEMAKYTNAGVIFIIQDKSGDYAVCGSTDDPIFLKKTFALGKKGNDKRGYTLKGEVDGLSFGYMRLQTALVATLEINTVSL